MYIMEVFLFFSYKQLYLLAIVYRKKISKKLSTSKYYLAGIKFSRLAKNSAILATAFFTIQRCRNYCT